MTTRPYDFSNLCENQTKRLRPHPLNAEVYGDSPDPALVDSISKYGIMNPIISDREKQILSGSRRWQAAGDLGIEKVPVLSLLGGSEISGDFDLISQLFLIESNRQRIKTESQKDAEAAALLRIERELAAVRQQAGVRQNSAEGGKAVEKVSKATGESADTVRKRAEIHAANIQPTVRNQMSANAAYENLSKATKCDICQQSFESKGAMSKHRTKEHADEMAKRKPSLRRVPVEEPGIPSQATGSNPSTPLQVQSETFYVIRRKADGKFYRGDVPKKLEFVIDSFQYVGASKVQVTSDEDFNLQEELDSFQKRAWKRLSKIKFKPSDFELVKVQAKYELTPQERVTA